MQQEHGVPFKLFHDFFPDIAEKETRTVTIPTGSPGPLPPGSYALIELFCDETGCDCRRVMFYVVSSRRKSAEAIVAFGWESREYYCEWLHCDEPQLIREMQGPVLNLGSPQSELAPAILAMIQDLILPDCQYVERVKRHYRMFRERIDAATDDGSQGPPVKRDKKTRRRLLRRVQSALRQQRSQRRPPR